MRQISILTAVLLIVALAGCGATGGVPVPEREGAFKTAADERALRRAYDGAPPVIPHEDFGMDCVGCHDLEGVDVEGVGFSPPMPHAETAGLSAMSRCQQCHVFSTSEAVFVDNDFAPLSQDLRHGRRLTDWSPPVVPHKILMRENCMACHTGPAAREEIRTTHPERVRCRQCHVEQTATAVFEPPAASGP